MKELILIRHAKSGWADDSLADWERPLNPRGRRDAPEMAERLAESDADVELLITSPAERARLTAQAFTDGLHLDDDEVVIERQLYAADEEDWLEIVESQPDYLNNIALVGHNPGLTEFLNLFLEEPLDNVPTCGVARLRFDIEEWERISEAEPVRVLYTIPKRGDWEELQ
jgi:phosphohistidine phosphatase